MDISDFDTIYVIQTDKWLFKNTFPIDGSIKDIYMFPMYYKVIISPVYNDAPYIDDTNHVVWASSIIDVLKSAMLSSEMIIVDATNDKVYISKIAIITLLSGVLYIRKYHDDNYKVDNNAIQHWLRMNKQRASATMIDDQASRIRWHNIQDRRTNCCYSPILCDRYYYSNNELTIKTDIPQQIYTLIDATINPFTFDNNGNKVATRLLSNLQQCTSIAIAHNKKVTSIINRLNNIRHISTTLNHYIDELTNDIGYFLPNIPFTSIVDDRLLSNIDNYNSIITALYISNNNLLMELDTLINNSN